MSLKTTFVLMVTFLVLGSFALFDPFGLRAKREQEKEREGLVFWLKDKKLESIRVKHEKLEARFECAKKDGCEFDSSADWNLVAPVKDQADPSSVGSLASSTLSLNPVETVDLEHEPDPKEFGLDSPSAELELRVKGESEPYTLRFGKESAVGPNVYAVSNRAPKRIYMIASYFPGMLKKELFHWRNKRLFPKLESENVERIEWQTGSKIYAIRKDKGEWRLEKPLDAAANKIMSEGLVSTLVYASAKDVISESGGGRGKPVYQFSIRTKEGEEKLSLYAAPPKSPGEKVFLAHASGAKGLYSVDATVFDRFGKDLLEYRERRMLSYDEKNGIDEMELYFPREKKRIVLKLAENDWTAAEGDKPAETLSQTRIKNFLDALSIAEATGFERGGANAALFRRVPGDLELQLRSSGALVKKLRFVLSGRNKVLSDGEMPNEVRILGEDFLKSLPVRFVDLYESHNKQVVVPAGAKESDGHDHSPGHQH